MTPRLGDQLPPELHKEFCEKYLIRGAVLKIFTDISVPPKVKLFVVWGIEKNIARVGFSFINSEININLFRNPSLRALHYPLSPENYLFLEHNSFLDCSRIYEMGFTRIQDLIIKTPEIHRGNILGDDLVTATNIIRHAITIEPIFKKRYGFSD